MPFYEYKCFECDLTEELLLSITQRELPRVCPKCSGEMERILSAGNFQLIGKGFYKPSTIK